MWSLILPKSRMRSHPEALLNLCGVARKFLVSAIPFRQREAAEGLNNAQSGNGTVGITSNLQSDVANRNFKPSKKILKVVFIGRPNAGKSTLINQIIGRSVCPISMKAHTTRLKAKAVLIENDTQLVFLDTPGLVLSSEVKKFKFEPSLLRSGEEALTEADLIGVIHDVAPYNQQWSDGIDSSTLRMLMLYREKKSFLVLNKVDAVSKKIVLLELCRKLIGDSKSSKKNLVPEGLINEDQASKLSKSMTSWPYFDEVFMISALEGDGVGDIKEYLLQQAHPGRWIFDPKKDTRQNREQLAVDFLRAAFLDALPAEVPYQLQFRLIYFEENDESCAIEIAVKPKHRRHESIIFKTLRMVAKHAESNLSSAMEKACRLRINILQEEK